MARRRGPGDAERLALDFNSVSATGAVNSFATFLYYLDFVVTDGTTTGMFSIADTTASTDIPAETARYAFKVGTAASSGNSDNHDMFYFNPPLYFSRQLFWGVSTGITSVSVGYLAAS